MTTADFTLRSGTIQDSDAISALFAKDVGYAPDLYVLQYLLKQYPSVVVFDGENLVGFAYTRSMSHDVLEILRITISAELRSRGIGTRILSAIETMAEGKYRAIVSMSSGRQSSGVLSTDDYLWGFYLKNGYNLIAETSATRIAWKELEATYSPKRRNH